MLGNTLTYGMIDTTAFKIGLETDNNNSLKIKVQQELISDKNIVDKKFDWIFFVFELSYFED